MKIEKLSLNGIKNVLSRAELKKIMAGSGGGTPPGNPPPGGCPNLGYAIPCCQCFTGGGGSCPYAFIYNSPPIPYECECYCQERGYSGGWNDCPISPC